MAGRGRFAALQRWSLDMRRLLAEIVVVVAIGIAAVVFVSTSGVADWLRGERPEPERPRYCHDRDLVSLGSLPVRGMAFLCLDGRSVELIAAPEGLVPGRAYTAWMLYSNDPRLCGEHGCEAPRVDDPQGRWILARIGGANADSQGMARMSTTYRGLRLIQGARVLVAVVDGGEPSAGALHEHAGRVLLPSVGVTPGSPVASAGLAVPGGSGSGVIVAHALFLLLSAADS
jgi:hypothetical protein